VKPSRISLLGVLLLLALTFMSCSGGGGGGGDLVDGGGIGGTGVAFGPITDFGSIVVNGVEFETTGASITFNGQTVTEAALRLGHVVSVTGTIAANGADGTATRVVFDSSGEGPVDFIDTARQRLGVLGQLVLVNRSTQFGNTTLPALDALAVGNVVALSGIPDADGVLRATRIDKTRDSFIPGSEVEREGIVRQLDRVNRTFVLGSLLVDFSTARIDDAPAGGLANGQSVEVRGRLIVLQDVLRADRVKVEDEGPGGTPGDEVRLAGVVTQFTSVRQFEVNGQAVVTTAQTEVTGGTLQDIALNVALRIEGVLNTSGELVAERIRIRLSDDDDDDDDEETRIEGLITQFTSVRQFEVAGRPVETTPQTIFNGGTPAHLAVGVEVRVRGSLSNGVLIADRVDFRD
jgi:Domain of unknown function (DUF5666)